ncbi:MAG TPA: PTS sugar transporter subunit IIA [Candidatus Krumholzibacteria bacterium]|nr:PTS sugar transporter subunit IIA [Candidatus Krumholzibacteria bacterium]
MSTPVMTSQELALYFRESACIFDLKATTKREALSELVEAVCADRAIRDSGLILEMLLNRESLGSTAIGKGVAFPHGRTLAVRELSVAFGRSARGIDCDAVDKQPTHIFFLILAPPQDKDNLYLQVLGRVVDLIKDDASRERIMGTTSVAELKSIVEGQAQ